MPDEIGQDSQIDTSTGGEQIQGNSQEQQQDNNPFWGDVQRSLPDSSWRTIKPYLDRSDAEARQRISDLNSRYDPWKALADQGYTPEQATQAFGVVQRLNDPNEQVALHESLGNFLRQNGRIPNQQELQQQNRQDNDGEQTEEDPRDAQIRQLMEQQQGIQQFLQFQQQAAARQEADRQADAWLSGEVNRVKQANPSFTDQDVQEVVRIAAGMQAQGRDINFDQAVQHYNGLANRFRTAPRAGDAAPRVPSGPGGGTPASYQQDGPMSKQDRIDAVTARLARG